MARRFVRHTRSHGIHARRHQAPVRPRHVCPWRGACPQGERDLHRHRVFRHAPRRGGGQRRQDVPPGNTRDERQARRAFPRRLQLPHDPQLQARRGCSPDGAGAPSGGRAGGGRALAAAAGGGPGRPAASGGGGARCLDPARVRARPGPRGQGAGPASAHGPPAAGRQRGRSRARSTGPPPRRTPRPATGDGRGGSTCPGRRGRSAAAPGRSAARTPPGTAAPDPSPPGGSGCAGRTGRRPGPAAG